MPVVWRRWMSCWRACSNMDSLLRSTYPTFPYFMGKVLNTNPWNRRSDFSLLPVLSVLLLDVTDSRFPQYGHSRREATPTCSIDLLTRGSQWKENMTDFSPRIQSLKKYGCLMNGFQECMVSKKWIEKKWLKSQKRIQSEEKHKSTQIKFICKCIKENMLINFTSCAEITLSEEKKIFHCDY